MAPRVRRRESELAFEALSIEGGLLAPEWLARVAQLQAGQQSDEDYRIPKGLSLRDEIGRYWRVAQAHWKEFAAGRQQASDLVRTRALSARFVRGLLVEAFEFMSLKEVPLVASDGRTYPITFAALGNRVPVVVAPAGEGVDAASPTYGDGGRRRSPFGLVQEFLNAAPGSTWGLVSDGCVFRIARDNASLTRPAWIEADLVRIFQEERYADFAVLWLLAHESRFGQASLGHEAGKPVECSLEAWREASREEGTRARDALRDGFEDALLALGQGFLSHPGNAALRESLQSGALTKEAYFQQLLRLVYRLIFLLTVEERGLLHVPGTSQGVLDLYRTGYSLRMLRDRAVRRSAHDRFSDLWQGLKISFRGLADGEEMLGLPALAGLFAKTQCAVLDASDLQNRFLLQAVFRLSWLRERVGLVRVNWRDMGPEELGSVYESLLELVPQITSDGRQFAFAAGAEVKGNARKTTGSYYTPDSLVQVLLDSALEPVIADTIAGNSDRPVEGLLGLSIVDPACGSGHFLLAAARRLAAHVARLQADATPSAAEYRHALRQIIGRCIYGVDQNPMAVELCQVSLWMEAVEPGLPLSFLDSHIQCGNSLLGTTPALMAQGVPDAAWEAIEGDDKKVANALKKRNKQEVAGFQVLPFGESDRRAQEAEAVVGAVAVLEAASDLDARALAQKSATWEGILKSDEYRHQKFVADAWCAAFVWPKQPGNLAEAAPTQSQWHQVQQGRQALALTATTVETIAAHYRFFHWDLQFPQIFAKGGFDVVVGNPPWDQMMFREQEFFANRAPQVASAASEASRKNLIAQLVASDTILAIEYDRARRQSDGERAFVLRSGRFPDGARGRVNTYLLFCELAATLSRGYAGMIVPTGVATDDSGRHLFARLFVAGRIGRLWDFENRAKLFPDVDSRARFCLLAVRPSTSVATDFCFGLHAVGDAQVEDRHFELTAADLTLINPNTRTCPSFLSRRDASLVKMIHRRVPVLLLEEPTPGFQESEWDVITKPGLFNMATDSNLFRGPETFDGDVLPVIEGKMISFFDHRFADVVISATALQRQGQGDELSDEDKEDPWRSSRPRYWVDAAEVHRRIAGQWDRNWIAGWKEITSPSNARTIIPAVMPLAAIGHKIPIFLPCASSRSNTYALVANLSSLVCDFVCRNKLNGTSLTPFTFKQLPVLSPATYGEISGWDRGHTVGDWMRSRVLELAYTAWDLEPFARDLGWSGPPFRWDPTRRFLLRAELDAAFFHLYGLSREDADYIMGTFPIVRKNDERAHGEYRTKRVILEIYDDMAVAARSGRPYATRLDPPPADPRAAHPDTRPSRQADFRAQ